MKLILTLDCEAEGQWDFGSPLSTGNVKFWPRFQELCDSYGIVPTYLLTSEIVEDGLARDLLAAWAKRDAAHVGAHLHPWTTPPYRDQPGLRFNDEVHAYPSQLPPDLLLAKLRTLTEQLTAAFGIPPTSYRAGRFGFDSGCARALHECGYLVDTSVTPYVSWKPSLGLDGVGGPDFSRLSPRPFRVADSGEPGLVEIPVTIMPTYSWLRLWPSLVPVYRGLPSRALRRLAPRNWLRDQPMPLNPSPTNGLQGLMDVWEAAAKIGLETAVMMFHSSELMPGGTPYRPTDESVDDLFECMDGFFRHVRRDGGEFSTLEAEAARLANDSDLVLRHL
jgi:hypothetical protein